MTEYELVTMWPDDGLHGRRICYTDKKQITRENVCNVVATAYATHQKNRSEIQYLYNYFRGMQDIRLKDKLVRPEINNKVVVNRANEIVTFKSGYFLDEPIQYVSNGGEDDVSQKVKTLNDYMDMEDKVSVDKELVDWMHICGVGVRMIVQDPDRTDDGSPLGVYALDPREAFVIYHSGVGHKPVAGVLRQKDEQGNYILCVFTETDYFELSSGKIQKTEDRTVPYIPIIEYENNKARMGAFEVVIPILNTLNTIESNRVDSIQDFVNAFDVFQNCEVDQGAYKELTKGGMAIMVKGQPQMEAKVYRISSELNQTTAQTLVDDLDSEWRTIVGMPNRNGGSSTSDTGAATIMRDGWQDAESRAEDTEKAFNRSERDFLRVALYILRERGDLDLKLSDIKIEHTRNNLSNMQSRMQILCEGLNNDKIHPKIPWIISGMPNSEEWYRISMEHYEEQQDELARTLRDELNAERESNGTESVPNSGQGSGTADPESDQEV
nr:MAG TPA: Portal [Caudoviricetes sp.]